MPSANEHPARGKVKEVRGKTVVFQPHGTNYELHLKASGGPDPAPADRPVDATIRVNARKVWTVPSGGNFVQPIFGPPRIIQGRVRHINGRTLIVHAGTSFIVEMPADDSAIDPARGPIEQGVMVNVTAMPGATIELPEAAVGAS